MNRCRTTALSLTLLALCGLFVLGGAGLPFHYAHDLGPEEHVLAAEYDQHVGEPITTSGVVVDPHTNQVHIEPDDTDLVVTLTIDPGHDISLTTADELSFSGTIAEDNTIVVGPNDYIWVRASWEVTYMFAISFLGAFLTGLLILNYWRFDPQHAVIEPREQPLHAILQED